MSHSPSRSVVIVVIAIALQVALGTRSPALQAQSAEISDLPKCQPFSTFPDLIASPAYSRDNTLFVKGFDPDLHDGFIIYSTDGGFSWTNPMLISHWAIVDVVFSPNYFNDQTIYLADTGNVLAHSTNSGRSWTSIPRLSTEGMSSLALTGANTVFLGVGGGPPYWYPQQGLFYSGDAGSRWERLYEGGVHDVALSPDYGDDHTILIGIAGYHWNGGILKSTDNGRTWQPSREGLPWGADGVTRDIAFSPGYAEDHTVFCLSWQGLYKSTDDGTTWQRLAPVPDGAPWGSIEQFLVSPRYPRDQTVWLRGDREGQLLSTDGGTTWRQMSHTVQPIAVAEAYCPQGGDCGVELFGYTWDSEHDYVYKSFDGGMTWHCLESAVTPMPTPTPPPPAPEIPEASTLSLLAGGLAGLAGYLRRYRR